MLKLREFGTAFRQSYVLLSFCHMKTVRLKHLVTVLATMRK